MRYYTEEQYNEYVKGSVQKQRKQVAYAGFQMQDKKMILKIWLLS